MNITLTNGNEGPTCDGLKRIAIVKCVDIEIYAKEISMHGDNTFILPECRIKLIRQMVELHETSKG